MHRYHHHHCQIGRERSHFLLRALIWHILTNISSTSLPSSLKQQPSTSTTPAHQRQHPSCNRNWHANIISTAALQKLVLCYILSTAVCLLNCHLGPSSPQQQHTISIYNVKFLVIFQVEPVICIYPPTWVWTPNRASPCCLSVLYTV